MFEGLYIANAKIAITTAIIVFSMLAIAYGLVKLYDYINEEVL